MGTNWGELFGTAVGAYVTLEVVDAVTGKIRKVKKRKSRRNDLYIPGWS